MTIFEEIRSQDLSPGRIYVSQAHGDLPGFWGGVDWRYVWRLNSLNYKTQIIAWFWEGGNLDFL